MSTKIEWTDETWNPVTGCTKVSEGCDHCYAELLHERFNGPGSFATITLHPERLEKPLRWRKPRRVFVNSMSDLFHADVPDQFIADVFKHMWWAKDHTFQVLTKRPGRMRSLVPRIEPILREIERDLALVDCPTPLVWPLPNVWLGVSVETQAWADVRIPTLLGTPAAVRFLSCEPLLGPVDLARIAYTRGGGTYLDVVNGRHGEPGAWSVGAQRIDWVIAGGESGKKARPMHPAWARSLRDQCEQAGVPFHFKQWGEWAPAALGIGMARHNVGREVLVGPALDDLGHRQVMRRVGKGKAGRELDGRLHDAFPGGQP